MCDIGAKGRQICAPSFVRGSSTFVIADGVTLIWPLIRLIRGGEDTSLISIINCLFSQRIEDGPTSNLVSLCLRADLPRSVIVNLPPCPYVATLIQTWFCGFFRPDHRYQGEKTDPINPMTETAFVPQLLKPSTYHHA